MIGEFKLILVNLLYPAVCVVSHRVDVVKDTGEKMKAVIIRIVLIVSKCDSVLNCIF